SWSGCAGRSHGRRSTGSTPCARLRPKSEMFDLRYHVASLAAVFLALIIGILVGVGISDRGLVDSAKTKFLQDEVAGPGARSRGRPDLHQRDVPNTRAQPPEGEAGRGCLRRLGRPRHALVG